MNKLNFNGIDKCYYSATINYTKADQKTKKMEKISKIVMDCKKVGIKVKLPRLNKCFIDTMPDFNDRVVYLSPETIKGLGGAFSEVLVSKNDFSSIEEFIKWSGEQYNYNTNDIGEVHKSKVFNKAKYLILIKIGFFDDFNSNMEEVWELINNYKLSEYEFREKKFIKTRQRWEYKCKNNAKFKEEIVDDYEKTCKVRIDRPLLDSKMNKLDGNKFQYQMELLEFMLDNPLSQYKVNLKDNEGLFCVQSVRMFNQSWGDSTLVTGFWNDDNISLPISFFISGGNYRFPKGTVLQLIYGFGKKNGKIYINKWSEVGKI